MRKALSYLLLLVAILSCMVGCSLRRPRTIPRDTLSEIFAEMFIADQWLNDNSGERRRADTMLFYEPIFRRYGYDSLDYINTIDKYIYEPDKFLKIVLATSEILDGKLKQKEAVKALIDKIKAANAQIKGYRFRDFSTDSVRWADSVVLWHRYALDSLQLDSLQLDSLQLDSLQLDSLRLDSLTAEPAVKDSVVKVEHSKEGLRFQAGKMDVATEETEELPID